MSVRATVSQPEKSRDASDEQSKNMARTYVSAAVFHCASLTVARALQPLNIARVALTEAVFQLARLAAVRDAQL